MYTSTAVFSDMGSVVVCLVGYDLNSVQNSRYSRQSKERSSSRGDS